MAPVKISLGGQRFDAAKPWGMLPQWALDRTTYIHHRTYQNAHPQYDKVMTLLGNVKSLSGNGTDQLTAFISAENAVGLKTIQQEQISLGGGSVSFQGRSIQSLRPTLLRDMLAPLQGKDAELQVLRDQTLDQMHALLKTGGTPAQKQWLDRHALSREQSRTINESLLQGLAGIKTNGADDQVRAAVILILMKISPVVTLHIPFGGDNHNDAELAKEQEQTISGVGTIKLLFEELKAAGLEDQVTFANFGVFGRTLRDQSNKGRDHNLNHHVMMIAGPQIKASVIGGIEPVGKDFGATAIDAATGKSVLKDKEAGADIPADQTLESTAKTLALALGISPSAIDKRIGRGKPIAAALKL